MSCGGSPMSMAAGDATPATALRKAEHTEHHRPPCTPANLASSPGFGRTHVNFARARSQV